MIFGVIEDSMGFAEFNATIRGTMRAWLQRVTLVKRVDAVMGVSRTPSPKPTRKFRELELRSTSDGTSNRAKAEATTTPLQLLSKRRVSSETPINLLTSAQAWEK
jgi:hypothetical protein